MKNKRRFSFSAAELFVLVFELNIGAAGLLMIASVFRGNSQGLMLPAQAMSGMLPAVMCVGFACWLVYRLRCVGYAKSRAWGLLAASCLSIVAVGFGAAVGKLNVVYLLADYGAFIDATMSAPVTREAGQTSLLAFVSIGLVFSAAFVFGVGKRRGHQSGNRDALHAQLCELGETVVTDWSEQLVSRMDALVGERRNSEAIRIYREETGCSLDEATCLVADWPEQRLRLDIELLRAGVNNELKAEASSMRVADDEKAVSC